MESKNDIMPPILDDSFILIKYNYKRKLTTQNMYLLVNSFLELLNHYISARSILNYHFMKVQNLTVKVPIYVYGNEDKNIDTIDLVQKRVDYAIEVLTNINWNKMSKYTLWVIRSLAMLDINISNSFVLSTTTPHMEFEDIINEPIHFKFPTLDYPEIYRDELVDGSIITYISDPYMNNYGEYLNLSIPFNEMGIMYNGLHIYEHVCVIPWDHLSEKDLVMYNGVTYINGLCLVYSVHKTINDMKLFASSSIAGRLKGRRAEYWAEIKNEIRRETIRTISETRDERSLSRSARSDLSAYDYKYNVEVFMYWSNKPFTMLIVGPAPIEELKLNKENINNSIRNFMPVTIERKENIKLKFLPIESLRQRYMLGYYSIKLDTEEVKKRVLNEELHENTIYGIDCYMLNRHEDLSSGNSVLHPLLFLNKWMTDEELKNYVRHNPIRQHPERLLDSPLNLRCKSSLQLVDIDETNTEAAIEFTSMLNERDENVIDETKGKRGDVHEGDGSGGDADGDAAGDGGDDANDDAEGDSDADGDGGDSDGDDSNTNAKRKCSSKRTASPRSSKGSSKRSTSPRSSKRSSKGSTSSRSSKRSSKGSTSSKNISPSPPENPNDYLKGNAEIIEMY